MVYTSFPIDHNSSINSVLFPISPFLWNLYLKTTAPLFFFFKIKLILSKIPHPNMGISKHVSFIIFLLTNHPLLIQPLPNQPNTNPSPPPTTHHINTSNPPDIAIIAGILTTIFSLTFLLLLYMKHCKKPENYATTYTNHHHAPSRVNSGLNRKLILSLPTFRFSSLKGQKDGLECAVCLSIFEPNEVLRLLPKCKHAFHVECVDTWLDAHSTCPLCRYRVDPEDALLIDYHNHQSNQTTPRNSNKGKDSFTNPRVSGRHSYACERSNTNPVPVYLGRSSLDSYKMKMKLSRKDGLLPVTKVQHKVEHRIIVGEEEETEEMRRWSDVQRSELLYLEMEMILEGNGSKVISGRSVSEIVGVSRCNKDSSNNNNNGEREEKKAVKRWLAWISQSQHKNNNTTTTAVLQQTTSTCSSDASSIVV